MYFTSSLAKFRVCLGDRISIGLIFIRCLEKLTVCYFGQNHFRKKAHCVTKQKQTKTLTNSIKELHGYVQMHWHIPSTYVIQSPMGVVACLGPYCLFRGFAGIGCVQIQLFFTSAEEDTCNCPRLRCSQPPSPAPKKMTSGIPLVGPSYIPTCSEVLVLNMVEFPAIWPVPFLFPTRRRN